MKRLLKFIILNRIADVDAGPWFLWLPQKAGNSGWQPDLAIEDALNCKTL
jgi:hypothetical protein